MRHHQTFFYPFGLEGVADMLMTLSSPSTHLYILRSRFSANPSISWLPKDSWRLILRWFPSRAQWMGKAIFCLLSLWDQDMAYNLRSIYRADEDHSLQTHMLEAGKLTSHSNEGTLSGPSHRQSSSSNSAPLAEALHGLEKDCGN